jgi:uncharacterized protein
MPDEFPPPLSSPTPPLNEECKSEGGGYRTRIKAALAPWTTGLSRDGVFVFVAATVLLIVYHEDCSSNFFRSNFGNLFPASRYSGLFPAFYWFLTTFLVLGLVPYLLGRKVLKLTPGELGVGFGDWRFGLKAVGILFAAFLPVLVAVSFSGPFQSKYPLFDEANASVDHFFLYELAYVVYFIGWEFVFRGFMLFGLKKPIGFYAVFVQTIPFALLHFGKPQAETFSAVVAGILLGHLALRTRSFWYGWLLHSLVAVSNDLLAVLHKM